MKAEQLTQKFADAGLGLTSLVAKNALADKVPDTFLVAMKEQLIRDAPMSAPGKFGAELTQGLISYFGLPAVEVLSLNQLIFKIADANIVGSISSNAREAIVLGKEKAFMATILRKLHEDPFKAHEFLGDALTFQVNNYIRQTNKEAQASDAFQWKGENFKGLIRFTRDNYTAVYSSETGLTKIYQSDELLGTHELSSVNQTLTAYLAEINQIVINNK